ncbi:MAG: hypothetical protein QM751_04045 [Paludibacteraceae bacterium]
MDKLAFSLLIVLSCFLQACDVSDTLDKGDTFSDAPYMEFSTKIVFQADAAKQYKVITYNDKDISIPYSILRTDTSGVLKVYNGTETTPELTATIKHHSGETISLIQLPGQTVQLYGTEAAAADPITRNRVKVRFLYSAANIATSDSVRMLMLSQAYSVVPSSKYDTVGTINIIKNKISPYIELNLSKYWTANSQKKATFRYLLYDYINLQEPTVLSSTKQTLNYNTTGESTDTNGPIVGYKLQTIQLTKSVSTYSTDFIFGTKWE